MKKISTCIKNKNLLLHHWEQSEGVARKRVAKNEKTPYPRCSKVHRNILTAHSDTLRAAFDHEGFTEAYTGVYTIAEGDINPQILEDVLKWMYFFNIPNASERADALLDAAEYFQMAGLREMCGRLLVDQLKVSVAIAQQYF